MNYYTSLVKQIDQLKAQGKIVKLTEADSSLISYIISDYVSMIDDNKFDDLEQYVNNNLNELI